MPQDLFSLSERRASPSRGRYASQMQFLRTLEPPDDPAFILQIVLVLFATFSGFLLLGVWQAAVWGVTYVVLQAAEKLVVRMIPDTATPRQYYAVLLVLFIESAVFCSLPVFLWFYGTDVAKFGAVALMTASAMHTTQHRAAFPSILSCFLVPNASMFAVIAVAAAAPDFLSAASIVYLIIGTMVVVFFIVMFFQAYQKEINARSTQETLIHSQKVETIGKLTGGIAHDFNNLISVVSGNLQLLRDADNLDEAKQLAERANTAAEACADLTTKMLAFGRKSPLHPGAVDVTAAMATLSGFTDRLVAKNVDVSFSVEPGTHRIFVDGGMLQNALLNLVINAADAMPLGGRIDLRVFNAEDGRVKVRVSDTGPGIPAAIREKVFDPFFTTKEDERRSGLGLSMVKGFVEQSNGTVELVSGLGAGTCVTLTFPSRASPGDSPEVSTELPTIAANAVQKRIMLVDDNRQLVEALAMKLTRDGYKVETYLTGDEAQEAIERDGAPDVLVTDAVMPGRVQGQDLIDFVRSKQPGVPTILMSGYAEPSFDGHFTTTRSDRFLSKPIDLNGLSHSVADLLAAGHDVAGSDALV